MISPRHSMQQQQGAVLIISLVLLLIITMVGISGTATTGLEEKMAANWQFKNLVFQAADAAIEEGLSDNNLLWKSYQLGENPVAPETEVVVNTDSRISSSVEAEFKGVTHAVGDATSSIREGAAGLQFYHYYVTGSADISAANAVSEHVRGAYMNGAQISDGLSTDHKVL